MKARVLCLHGYSMNGAWLKEWLQPIELALEEQTVFFYPDAPISCNAEEVKKVWRSLNMSLPAYRLGAGKNFCWYRATDSTPPTYREIENSFAAISKLIAKDGPFDGVIAWSQGAMLAAILLAMSEHSEDTDYGFKWAVLGAGAKPSDPRFLEYIEQGISTPTLQILGNKEPKAILARYHDLCNVFTRGQQLITPVGHVFPFRQPSYMARISTWIKVQIDNR